MKNIQHKLIGLLFMVITLPFHSFSQDSLAFDLSYEINKVYPYISISKKQLKEAKTLVDLNRHYKPSWVREYISVEIWTNHNGKTNKAVSESDNLTQEQKDIMNMVDDGSDISVKIKYVPENTLKENEPRETDFTFTIEPESAKYVGGGHQLKKYLKTNAIDKISKSVFKIHNLTAVKFTINEEGAITDAHIAESSKDEKTDEILLTTICNMPNWQPAVHPNGTKVKQEFAFTVGDMRSCVVNLLNIRKFPNED